MVRCQHRHHNMISIFTIENLAAKVERRVVNQTQQTRPVALADGQLTVHKSKCGDTTLTTVCPLDGASLRASDVALNPAGLNEVVEKLYVLLNELLLVCIHAREMTPNDPSSATGRQPRNNEGEK